MPLNVRPPGGRGNAGQMRSQELRDFRGGLNLSDDLFKVGDNESPDMLNLDVHARGGLVLRGGMRARSDVRPGSWLFDGVYRFKASDGSEAELLVSVLEDGAPSTVVDMIGGTQSRQLWFTETDVAGDDGLSASQMNDRLYFFSKRYSPRFGSWDGTEMDWGTTRPVEPGVSGSEWGDPNVAPSATLSAVWDNRMWVGNTKEAGVDHRNRLRWSADGNPEVWSEDDWIDVDVGEDGDCITALEVHGEILMVFKRRSVYALVQDDSTLYRRVDISRSVGAAGPHAVKSTPYGLMFWDSNAGLHAWNEGQPSPIGDKIIEAIHEDRIVDADDVRLSWANSRLWCTVDFDGERSDLLFDPRLGAWTRYSPSVELVHEFDGELRGWSANLGRYLAVELHDRVDDLGSGGEAIPAHWVSSWIHGGSHIVEKRWRRPRMVLASSSRDDLRVEVRADLDPRKNVRTFNVTLPGRTSLSSWGSSTWGDAEWGSASVFEFAELVRGPAIGNFNSIQFRVSGPKGLTRWRLDAVTASYIPKVMRS